MDITEFKKSEKYEILWLNPQTENSLLIKYVRPWQWVDFVMFTKSNLALFNAIYHPFALVHDFSLFPNFETSVSLVYENLATKLPPLPPNLKLVIIVNPCRNNILEIGFEVGQSLVFRKKFVFFVSSMDEAENLLVRNGLM